MYLSLHSALDLRNAAVGDDDRRAAKFEPLNLLGARVPWAMMTGGRPSLNR